MKKILFLIFLSAFASNIYAQTVQEPEFELEPYVQATDSTLGDMLPVENAYAKAKASASMFIVGVGKVKTYWYCDGNQSSMELDNKARIVINTGGKSPMQILSINKMEQMGKKRRYQCGEAGTFTGATSGKDNSSTFKYKKYGKDSVVIPLTGLEPGEYALSITNGNTNSKSSKVYTFRIK